MNLTILFDLDHTLLQTNLDDFIPKYFEALGQALSHFGPPQMILDQMQYAVHKMTLNQDPGLMLNEVFAKHFYEPLGFSEKDCQQDLNYFYEIDFPKLRSTTDTNPHSATLIDWCKKQHVIMAIATNPLFPRAASVQRLQWAGLIPTDFEFISTFEDFHFTKPSLNYYAECLGRLGWLENPSFVIGDDLYLDILPAESFDMRPFWIIENEQSSSRPSGKLSGVIPFLEGSQTTQTYTPPENIEISNAILNSTPAVFDTWLRQNNKATLHKKPASDEWSLNEVLWHLADYEKEVFLPQWQTILSQPEKVITPVETSHWADERQYYQRDPKEGFERFLESRRESIKQITWLIDLEMLNKSVNHSIFSRTTTQELIAFAAKHDRVHLRQSKILLDI